MKLVGVEKIVSKKTGQAFMKLYMLSPVPKERGIGEIASEEFISFNEDVFPLVGKDIIIHYTKGFDGRAIVDNIEAKR